MTRSALIACVCVCLLASGPARSWEPPASTNVPAALAKKVAHPAVPGTLGEAVDHLAKLAGVKITVDWAALEATGVKKARKVAVRASGATIEQLLDLVLRQAAAKNHPLAWYVDGQAVRVTTQRLVLNRNRMPALASRRGSRSGGGIRELDFHDTPLGDVISFLRDASGVNFHVNWRALELVNIDRNTPVTLQASYISVARALDLVTNDLSATRDKLDSVYWLVDEGIVMISTGAALNTSTRTRVYDIGDLLMVVPSFVPARMSTDVMDEAGPDSGSGSRTGGLFENPATGGGTAGSGEPTPAEQRRQTRETLISVLKDSIGPEMWQPEGKGAIKILHNRLIVTQTPLGFLLMSRTSRRR